jgi:hypothetical protein
MTNLNRFLVKIFNASSGPNMLIGTRVTNLSDSLQSTRLACQTAMVIVIGCKGDGLKTLSYQDIKDLY